MATWNKTLQALTRLYREETGFDAVDMHKVAAWAHEKHNIRLPTPPDPLELLAKQFAKAAREEIRHDEVTGRPYRANHSYSVPKGDGKQLSLWVDMDRATRGQMHRSLGQRREQMVGDAFALHLDVDHWNRINPKEEPLQLELDFRPDVEWRMNTPDDDKEAA